MSAAERAAPVHSGFSSARGFGLADTPAASAAPAAVRAPGGGAPGAAAASALPIALQAASALLGPQDAYEDAGVLEAKIKNYQQMKRKFPLLAGWYDNEIRKMKAKLEAAKRRTSLQAEGEQATREWRSLGYALAAGGVLVLISGAVALGRAGRK